MRNQRCLRSWTEGQRRTERAPQRRPALSSGSVPLSCTLQVLWWTHLHVSVRSEDQAEPLGLPLPLTRTPPWAAPCADQATVQSPLTALAHGSSAPRSCHIPWQGHPRVTCYTRKVISTRQSSFTTLSARAGGHSGHEIARDKRDSSSHSTPGLVRVPKELRGDTSQSTAKSCAPNQACLPTSKEALTSRVQIHLEKNPEPPNRLRLPTRSGSMAPRDTDLSAEGKECLQTTATFPSSEKPSSLHTEGSL